MSVKLTIFFTRDLPAETEVFERASDAIAFAKRIARDGYVTDRHIYPSHLIGRCLYEPSKEERDPPAPGHGHY